MFPGEHEAIIDEAVFQQVQEQIVSNGNDSGGTVRNQHGALLKGLLRCGKCGAAMAHTYTNKKGRLYRYYACNTRQKQGTSACDTPSLPAQEIEDQVVNEIRKLARDPEMIEQVSGEVIRQHQALIPKLEAERKRLARERQQKGDAIQRLVATISGSDRPSPSLAVKLGELEAVVERIGERVAEIDGQLAQRRAQVIDKDHLAQTLREFDQLWEVMYPAERGGLVRAVIQAITLTDTNTITILFHTSPPES